MFRKRDTISGDFRDGNICAYAASASILLPVVNLSPEMDSATPIYGITRREHFGCIPTYMYKGIVSKLVKNRKLNYAHARNGKSLTAVV